MFPKALAIFLFLFILMAAPVWAQPSNSDQLEAEADMALARLNTLDSVLDTHPAATAADLDRMNREFNLDLPAIDPNQPMHIEHLMGIPGTERPYGISPFVWGLLLNVPGALVVYLLTGERRPTHHAIFGAIVGGIAIALLYFIVISPT